MTRIGQDTDQESPPTRADLRGTSAVFPAASRRTLVGTALLWLGGCDGAPSRGILGSYFPSWMICALIGLAVAMIVRSILKASGLLDEMPVPLIAILATACAVTFAVWLVWLA